MRFHPALVGFMLVATTLLSQTPAPPAAGAPVAAPYTLRATARTVLTDVVVQDRKGNPVRGLPQSAFHLYDNGKPVTVASFEEHTGTTSAPPPADKLALAPGTFTNDPARLPAVLNIAVLDIVELSLPDQMFLAYQMEKFFKTFPANAALRVYFRGGERMVLLQDFSSDRVLLGRAVHSSLPRFASSGTRFQSALASLEQIAADLKDLPGRKNVIWFSGGATLSFNAAGFATVDDAALRAVFDDLESERIAVYPIDARGLTTALPSGGRPQTGTAEGSDGTHQVLLGDPDAFKRDLMRDVARATGGIATFNDNGLALAAQSVVENDSSFYTLAFTPGNLQVDNKWHKVKVEADGRGLHLSYRRGYFADDAHVVNPKDKATRTRLLSGGHTVQETPTVRREPIVFSASAQPLATGAPKPQIATPPAAGITRYRVHYAVPVSAFQRHSVQGQSLMDVGMGILALNRNGVVLTRKLRHAEFGIDEDKLSRAPATVVPIDQDVDLAGGDTYLYLVVWDPAGERIGTLNVPLQVPK